MIIKSVEFLGSFFEVAKIPRSTRRELAVFGRSNVGKSSFINKILGRRVARTSAVPGKTQSLNYYLINEKFHLVDTPGYGYAKVPIKVKEAWKKLMENFVANQDNLSLAIQLIDSKIPPQALDLDLLGWLLHHGVRTCLVATKIDRLKNNQRSKSLKILQDAFGQDIQPFSSKTGEGRVQMHVIMKTL